MRYIKNNRIAVLTNPNSGWYTQHKDLIRTFDPELVQKVLDGVGPPGLEIEWLVPGDRFRIEIVDGKEVITVLVVGSVPITGSLMSAQKEFWLTA